MQGGRKEDWDVDGLGVIEAGEGTKNYLHSFRFLKIKLWISKKTLKSFRIFLPVHVAGFTSFSSHSGSSIAQGAPAFLWKASWNL